MSRVVPDQRRKFENDELFRKLRNESQVKYIGAKDKQPKDKSSTLLEDCKKKQLEIAFVGCGITLTLLFKFVVYNKRHNLPSDFVEVDREENMIRMASPFIFNGVCVMFKGWLDLERLEGKGHLEFDPSAAREEEERLYHHYQYQQIRMPSSFGEVTYRPETPESSSLVESLSGLADSFRFPQTFYRYESKVEFPHIEGALSSTAFPHTTDIPFLSPSTSPSEQKETSSHHEPHWKKRIRQNSEPSREPSVSIPFSPSSTISFFEHYNIRATEIKGVESEVLDLSVSSKTHPPMYDPPMHDPPMYDPPKYDPPMHDPPMYDPPMRNLPIHHPSESRERSPSLDDTVMSFHNISLKKSSQQKKPGLTPKKKYSNWDLETEGVFQDGSLPAERRIDSSTQTSSDDCLHKTSHQTDESFSPPLHGSNPGVDDDVIKAEIVESVKRTFNQKN